MAQAAAKGCKTTWETGNSLNCASSFEEVDGTGTVLARYSQGPSIDQPLDVFTSGATKFYDADGLGSITSLADISASLTDTYTTDTFGNTTASSGTTRNPYRYTARDLDSETGLMYYRARYYDPSIGRFLNEDPIGLTGGLNLYRYVNNRPTRYVDPLGMAATSVDASMEQAIGRGDLAEIRAILQTAGDELSPGMRQAAEVAVENGDVDAGGAKSARELVKHLNRLQQAEDELAALRDQACKVSGKARQALQEDIEELLKSMKGHIKEIWQKWGIGK